MIDPGHPDTLRRKNDELRELAAELARQLAGIQWSTAVPDPVNDTLYSICPVCDQSEVRTHSPDCRIGGLLERPEVQALLAEQEGK